MKRLIDFCQKYEIFIRLIILAVFFMTLFLPYYYVPLNRSAQISLSINNLLLPAAVNGYSISLKYQAEYYKTTYYLFQIILYCLILAGLILSIFRKKSAILKIFSNGTALLFIGFFFSILYELIRLNSLWEAKLIPHISFYIWALLLIIDCIYLFLVLQKAFPFKKKEINEVEPDENKSK